MLLKDKTAVIYGGSGAIGSAVARTFAREGARVFLAARTPAPLERVASEIGDEGGAVEAAVVDALDEQAVDAHAADVAARAGGIDISFNLISHNDVQGTPLAEMPFADFQQPVMTALRTNFLTARAAARHMIPRRSGVILMFGGYGDPTPEWNLGGLQVAFQAVEALRRQLAGELGRYGIRALTIQTAGIVDTIPEDFEGGAAVVEDIVRRTLLKRAATREDVANVAAFAASDRARSMTATAFNITCGTVVDRG
ncbi:MULTISPECIES: SDR family oxidoreductase [unclassified Streptomyces]|uniref:SDR family NAD(P)-dependent oxidoreductase n=1 Tax=unclassified Streptomyces TaxID=2593676 RepID=UPI00081D9097|nr:MULTISPECIES: SDR family oxidoreductase [unclassified Streptomyces]MYZ33790.1 SDR family oxidoreductase [Streptomyces sp. SID4917]SCF61797.1 NAD(P)-dependent dehydrogenase, short-chain alcohol dehydrogenase family [Streptomyces sp. MnatMP-M17]